MYTKVSIRTRKSFSFGWSKFARSEVKKRWHKDSFSYLSRIPKEIFSEGKIGLDIGCGSGSDMINIAKYRARIFGMDISDSVNIAKENTKELKNTFITQADIYNLPFRDYTFDFVYSFGVLHHLSDPQEGFRKACSVVKSGGYIIIYVYEDFSNRSIIERSLLNAVNSLRFITKRIPPSVLYFCAILASPIIFLCCSLPYQLLKRVEFTRKIAEKIPYRHTCNLGTIASDLYDRFSPPIEHRYSRKQVEDWFKEEKLEDINVFNYRGWVAWGRKK